MIGSLTPSCGKGRALTEGKADLMDNLGSRQWRGLQASFDALEAVLVMIQPGMDGGDILVQQRHVTAPSYHRRSERVDAYAQRVDRVQDVVLTSTQRTQMFNDEVFDVSHSGMLRPKQ